MDLASGALLQYGALGLAAIVVGLSARFVTSVMRDAAQREKMFFTQMDSERAQFSAMLEKHTEKFSELSKAFDRMAASFTDIATRLEAIEDKVGTSHRRRASDR